MDQDSASQFCTAAEHEEGLRSLASIKEMLDRDYRRSEGFRMKPEQQSVTSSSHLYDTDAFDSMAVMNSEIWGGDADETGLTSTDLLPNGAGSLSKTSLKDTFLKAAQTGILDVVRDLYDHCGPDILMVVDNDQYTPLHRASYNGHTHVVEFLLSKGADVTSRTIDGWQPIHCACRWNKVEVASLLLQNGALVNSQTKGGQTPLHVASSNDRSKDVLELLLSQPELELGIRNGQGEVAHTVASRNGRYAYLFTMVEASMDHRKFLKEV